MSHRADKAIAFVALGMVLAILNAIIADMSLEEFVFYLGLVAIAAIVVYVGFLIGWRLGYYR